MFDLGYGNSVAVREAFLSNTRNKKIILTTQDSMSMDYPSHTGDTNVINLTKEVIKRQTSKEYKHVFITNGATGACVISMRAYYSLGKTHCRIRKAPYYIMYPIMIESSGLKHDINHSEDNSITMWDYPGNPTGSLDFSTQIDILDGVYLNGVYHNLKLLIQDHKILVGSYSKLTGINGIRLGWIACNDDALAKTIETLVTAEYSGMSSYSSFMLLNMTKDFDWGNFEKMARLNLDYNREEWSKLERFFDTPVNSIGMFHYSAMDKKAQDLFKKANIIWTKGSSMGTDDTYARFNIGQSNVLIRDAVKTILKIDRI